MDETDRRVVEEIIDDVQACAERYLTSPKEIYRKMLEVSVEEAIDLLKTMREELAEDPMAEAYRLNLFVPIQLAELIKIREGKTP